MTKVMSNLRRENVDGPTKFEGAPRLAIETWGFSDSEFPITPNTA
jgi:hypothetical protein